MGERKPGNSPLDAVLGVLSESDQRMELDDPGAEFSRGFGGEPTSGPDSPATPEQPELPEPKGRASKDPYRVSVVAIQTGVTPATYLRCLAFWSAPQHQERAKLLAVEGQLREYLDTVTFQHAAEDEQRPDGERLYDWEELHMQGLRPKIQAEMDAIRAQVAQETARGTRDTMVARISVLELPETVKAKVLAAIEEVGSLGLT